MTAGVGPDGGGGALGDALAVVQHDDVVANAHHDAHVVLDQQDGAAIGLDGFQQRGQRVALTRVEAGGWLVQAEQDWGSAHGARNLQPALIAVGEGAGRVVGAGEQVDPLEPRAGACEGQPLGPAIAACAEYREQARSRRWA